MRAIYNSSSDSVADSPLTAYLNDIGRVPLLSRQREQKLFIHLAALRTELRDAKDALANANDPAARERHRTLTRAAETVRGEIIRANLRLPVAIAKHFRGNGVSMADLVQEGSLGLMHAVEKFDPDRGVRFSAYAAWWIQQAVRLAIAQHARTVRLPTYIQQWQRKLRQASAGAGGRQPIRALAEEVGITEDQVRRALEADTDTVSLDGPAHGDGSRTVAESLEDVASARPDFAAERAALRQEIEAAFKGLDPRTERILRLRYGFEDGTTHSLQDVGNTLDLSRERIRQLEAAALDHLRHPARSARLRDFSATSA